MTRKIRNKRGIGVDLTTIAHQIKLTDRTKCDSGLGLCHAISFST